MLKQYRLWFCFITVLLLLMSFSQMVSGEEVLNCSQGESCAKIELDRAIEDCEPWGPWVDRAPNCTSSLEGANKVTLIADPANYITSDFTDLDYKVEKVNLGLTTPWDLEFLPGGSMILTEKGGGIKKIDEGEIKTLKDLSPIVSGETGLLGLTLDPDFEDNKHVYVYYGKRRNNFSFGGQDLGVKVMHVVERFTLVNNTLVDGKVILDNIPGNKYHSGGRIDFGPDEKLYVATGDAKEKELAGNVSFLGGKILRVNKDGSVPASNPYPGSPVYSKGHRNPQGLSWHPSTANLYASEHGPWRHDELNLVKKGEDYGWDKYMCDVERGNIRTEDFINPVFCVKNWTMAPSGMTFVGDESHPWYGNLFLTNLRGNHLHRFEIEDGSVVGEEVFFVARDIDELGISRRLRDVEFYNGSLYVIGDKKGMVKLTPERKSFLQKVSDFLKSLFGL